MSLGLYKSGFKVVVSASCKGVVIGVYRGTSRVDGDNGMMLEGGESRGWS